MRVWHGFSCPTTPGGFIKPCSLKLSQKNALGIKHSVCISVKQYRHHSRKPSIYTQICSDGLQEPKLKSLMSRSLTHAITHSLISSVTHTLPVTQAHTFAHAQSHKHK